MLPQLVAAGNAFEHRHRGYWRDVGTVESYYNSQLELLDQKTKIFFDDEDWQVLTLDAQRIPAYIAGAANAKNCLAGTGSKIYGSFSRSILSSGVVIEKGARVSDAIILPNVSIQTGVDLRRVTKKRAAQLAARQKTKKNGIFIIGKRRIEDSAEIEK